MFMNQNFFASIKNLDETELIFFNLINGFILGLIVLEQVFAKTH